MNIVTPRPAATTLLLRDGAPGLEVLMVRRSLQASFMPGSYVFPGGAVDAADGQAEAQESAGRLADRVGRVTETGEAALAYAVAALRECFEECGLWPGAPAGAALAPLRARLHGGESFAALAAESGLPLATAELRPWSHWCTPVGMPKRFDTLFFVAHAPAGQDPTPDAGETTALAWVHPPAALRSHADGGFPMEFATVRTVESLAPFAAGSVAALLAHAAGQRSLPAIHPRLRRGADGRIAGVLLPGEPGYDEAAG